MPACPVSHSPAPWPVTVADAQKGRGGMRDGFLHSLCSAPQYAFIRVPGVALSRKRCSGKASSSQPARSNGIKNFWKECASKIFSDTHNESSFPRRKQRPFPPSVVMVLGPVVGWLEVERLLNRIILIKIIFHPRHFTRSGEPMALNRGSLSEDKCKSTEAHVCLSIGLERPDRSD